MPRIALYARYSSENQRDASIEDQLRMSASRAVPSVISTSIPG